MPEEVGAGGNNCFEAESEIRRIFLKDHFRGSRTTKTGEKLVAIVINIQFICGEGSKSFQKLSTSLI